VQNIAYRAHKPHFSLSLSFLVRVLAHGRTRSERPNLLHLPLPSPFSDVEAAELRQLFPEASQHVFGTAREARSALESLPEASQNAFEAAICYQNLISIGIYPRYILAQQTADTLSTLCIHCNSLPACIAYRWLCLEKNVLLLACWSMEMVNNVCIA
jgi:hypothetical protein